MIAIQVLHLGDLSLPFLGDRSQRKTGQTDTALNIGGEGGQREGGRERNK